MALYTWGCLRIALSKNGGRAEFVFDPGFSFISIWAMQILNQFLRATISSRTTVPPVRSVPGARRGSVMSQWRAGRGLGLCGRHEIFYSLAHFFDLYFCHAREKR
jgi:hypothetical protein